MLIGFNVVQRWQYGQKGISKHFTIKLQNT
jgi:hypothetical protein